MSRDQRDNEAHNDNVNQRMQISSTTTAPSHQESEIISEENEGESDSLVKVPVSNGQSNGKRQRQSYISAMDRESTYPVQ